MRACVHRRRSLVDTKTEDDQEESERGRGKETWWSQGFVSSVPVYLFLLWATRSRALHTLDVLFPSLARSRSRSLSLFQRQTGILRIAAVVVVAAAAAAGKNKKLKMQKKQKKQKKKKTTTTTTRKTTKTKMMMMMKETQKGKYGRNCRRLSFSADCSASVWHKNREIARKKGKKNKNWRNIENTNKYKTYATMGRTRKKDGERKDFWNAYTSTGRWQKE